MNSLTDLLSEDCGSFLRSPVREIFRKVDFSKIYAFSGGYPDADTFPMEQIKSLCTEVLDKYGTACLQYSTTQGEMILRKALSSRYNVPVDNIQVTTSSQQGIDVCSRILLDPGDVVLTLNPCYLGALQSFAAYRAKVVAMDIDAADAGVSEEDWKRVKMCYVVADFQNPSGETMSFEHRKRLVELARERGFVILEDAPYRELRYSGEMVPTIYSMAPEICIHLGSFSKIFAPGVRLGWMFGPQELLEQVFVCKQALDLCPPVMSQYIVAEYMMSGNLDKGIAFNVSLYRRKRDKMLELLEKYMPEGVSWTKPEGGLFVFVTLPESVDTVELYDKALDAGVSYVSGSSFYSDMSHRNTMRLTFSFLPIERMEAGIKILSDVIREAI